MEIVAALLNASPVQAAQLLYGVITGATILAAIAMSSAFRRIVTIVASLVLLYLIFTQGPLGVEGLGKHLLTAARKYELFVKGIVAGKVVIGAFWRFKPSERGAIR